MVKRVFLLFILTFSLSYSHAQSLLINGQKVITNKRVAQFDTTVNNVIQIKCSDSSAVVSEGVIYLIRKSSLVSKMTLKDANVFQVNPLVGRCKSGDRILIEINEIRDSEGNVVRKEKIFSIPII